jgi:hypothetical protein
MSNYLSNRVKNLKIGIKGYTESTDVLDILGDSVFEGAINLKTSSNSIEIKPPVSLATDLSFTLPTSDGDADQVLATDGNGVLSWVTRLSGSGSSGDFLSSSTASTQSGYFGDIYLYDDSTPSHYLQVTNSANLTAARSLSINVNDANRTISLSGNLTLANNFTTSGNFDVTLTATNTTSITLPTSGTLATTSNKLSAFASTSSSELAGVISDETGSGSLVFATSPTFTTSITLSAQGEVRFADSDSSNYVSLRSPTTVSANVTLTLPDTDGDANQALITDGNGVLSWASISSGISAITIDTTLADILSSTGGTISADDAASDKLVFWDDSAGKLTYLTVGTGLSITDTTISSTISSADFLSSSTTSTQSGYFGNIYLYDDSTPSHYLEITNSDNLSALRTLSINVNDANRTVSLSGNLTLANNFTTSGNFAVTLTATSTTSITLPTSGTLATTSNKLSAFAATSSSELAGVISDETGSGSLVFATSPSFTTSITLNAQGEVRFADSDSSNYISFEAPATVVANRIYTLPATIGSAGDVLKIASGATATDATLEWGAGGASITITDDTSTSSPQYLTFSSVTSGTLSSLNVSSTNITFTPSTGNLVVSGTVTANSDEKLKTNIKTIENALDKVLSLRGVEFDRVDTGDHQIGVIAQEVEQIIPDVVYPKQPLPDYETKSVAYSNIVALLIEAIKEQNQKIADLERRLEER